MRFRNATIALLSLSMTATPVVAQSAVPLSVVATAQRAGPEMPGSNSFMGEYGVAIAFFAIAIGLVFLLDDDDNNSTSR